jgi:hypothetical protein
MIIVSIGGCIQKISLTTQRLTQRGIYSIILPETIRTLKNYE